MKVVMSTGMGKTHTGLMVLAEFLALRGWRTPPEPGTEPSSRYVEFTGELSPTTPAARRGEQGVVRARKLAGRAAAPCALCRAEYPQDLLELAHIKPRTVCTDQEKLDLWNTMLACSQCHSLFDKGLLWVDLAGVVRWEGGFPPGHPLTMWGERVAGGRCLEFRDAARGFFRARLSYSRVTC
ncbi:HNH endonuclease signature motif containing protein [Nocardiopsis sp. FR26]|uniref:HNH endonuclease signature motif containing protein n=1 Tax=Nocardiopsis sp. FR26 TaxID=2605987 RepID=UPI001357123C|nr:HNH endonuclease signature motif containing protein [Nocardiopsis sp. FR26]